MKKMKDNISSIAVDQIGLAAPAVRALQGAGYTKLEQLAQVNEHDLAKLHGMGPNALKKLRQALADAGLREPVDTKLKDPMEG